MKLPGLGNANGGQAHNSIRNLQWSEYRKSNSQTLRPTVRGLFWLRFVAFHLFVSGFFLLYFFQPSLLFHLLAKRARVFGDCVSQPVVRLEFCALLRIY